MGTEKIVNYYERDHDRLDGLFKAYLENKPKDLEKAKGCFKDFLTGLKRHIVWEEEILFPAFEAKTGMRDSGPTAVMRMEHRQIHGFLDGIHEAVRRGEPCDPRIEQSLMDTLGQHNVKEENVLYPMLDNLLSEEERAEVFRKMEALPKERYDRCCG